nr:deaminase [Nocardioides sp. MAH-18]
MADAFIALSPGRDSSEPAGRLIRLLFGSPYETPDRHEQAMYFCSGASMRSSDAGRQVGAVVVDDDGELLVTGVNEVPKPLGGQYWSDDEVDLRDFKIGYDENARQKLAIVTDLMKSLAESEWLGEKVRGRKPEDLAREAITEGGPLAKNRIGDLLEFARVAHAEMAAICTAARRGIPIGGQTMYTTTYPCHECARLIIAAGIRKVVYIDPYPKSQVRVMYAREVTDSDVGVNGTVAFEPFKGVAPRLFRSVFRMTGRDRDEVTGEYAKWDPRVATPRLVTEALVLPDATTYESKLYEPVYDLLTTADWEGVFKKAFPLPT